MSAEKFMRAGIRFHVNESATVPTEVPSVQDVMYVLRLTETPKHYATPVNKLYLCNVHMAAGAACTAVVLMKPYDEKKARRIIGQTILTLCPVAAQTNESPAYLEALECAGLSFKEASLLACRLPDVSDDLLD